MKEYEYSKAPSKGLIDSQLSELKKDTNKLKNKEVLLQLLNCIDLTSLNTTDTTEKIKAMTQKVSGFSSNFPQYKNVAAICVYPSLVPIVKGNLTAKNVKIAAVGAGFPSSQTFVAVKAAECELTVHKGADEIDIVISVGSFLEKNYNKVAAEIQIIKESIGDAHLKVILETGELLNTDNIHLASIIAMEAGADFIKTSTGFSTRGASLEDIAVINRHKSEKLKIKASGGIRTVDSSLKFIAAGVHRIGSSNAGAIIEECRNRGGLLRR